MKQLITFVVVFLALAVPASARNRYHSRFGSSSELDIAQQNMRNTFMSPINQLAQNLCENHRGTGDAMEASWCYGQVSDGYGRVVGYNPNSVAGQSRRSLRRDSQFRIGRAHRSPYDRDLSWGYHRDSRRDRYNSGRGISRNEILGTVAVIGGAWAINKIADHHDHETEVKQPQMTENISGLVKNETGEALSIDGRRLEDGQRMRVSNTEQISVATLRGSECRVEAEIHHDSISLFCKEGD